MTEKQVGYIAIFVILMTGGWLYKYKPLPDEQLLWVACTVLAMGTAYLVVARRAARRTVIRRRRFYKELWRRGSPDQVPSMTKPEEGLVVLLGRIKGVMIAGVMMVLLTTGALVFGATNLAIIAAMGQWFVAARLHATARSLGRAVPSDETRGLPVVPLPPSPTGRFRVVIDLKRAHDFILPPAALPFWGLAETKRWLATCGFTRTSVTTWEADEAALHYLDPDEIGSLEPVSG